MSHGRNDHRRYDALCRMRLLRARSAGEKMRPELSPRQSAGRRARPDTDHSRPGGISGCIAVVSRIMTTPMTYIQPLVLIFLTMAFIGLVRLRHCKGSCLASSGVLGLLLLSWPPVDWLVSRPLEGRYPIRPFPPVLAQAIVVLSSAVSPPLYERPYPLPDRETFERCEYAAWLHTHWQPLPVLACGGRGTTM